MNNNTPLITFSCVNDYTCHLNAIDPYRVLLETEASDIIMLEGAGTALQVDPNDPCRIIPVEGSRGIITIEADEYIVEAVMYIIHFPLADTCLELLGIMAGMKRAYFGFLFGLENPVALQTNPYITAINTRNSYMHGHYISTGVRVREDQGRLTASFSVLNYRPRFYGAEIVQGNELHWLSKEVEIVPIYQNVEITPAIIVSLLLQQNIVPVEIVGEGESKHIAFEEEDMGRILDIIYHSLNRYYEADSANRLKSARKNM